jgi:hypothetical protein
MQDEVIRWISAGIISSIVKDVLGVITLWTKIVSYHIVFIAADIFMDSPDIRSFKGCLLGLVVDLIIGGSLGMVVGVFLKRTSYDYYLLKGFFLGLLVWLVFIGFIMHTLLFVFSMILIQFNDLIQSMIAHVVYGTLTAYLIIRLDPNPIRK